MRWVEVRDDRATNRVRWMQIPMDEAEPAEAPEPPAQVERTRHLVQDLIRDSPSGGFPSGPRQMEDPL
jgi:hypothetical protein